MRIDIDKKQATKMARTLSERLHATTGVAIGHQTAMHALAAAFGYDDPNAFAAALKVPGGAGAAPAPAAGHRKDGSKPQTCCPLCRSTDLARRRGAFLESGPYDDHRGEYAEECNVDGYRCRACGEEFFLGEGTRTTVPGEPIGADAAGDDDDEEREDDGSDGAEGDGEDDEETDDAPRRDPRSLKAPCRCDNCGHIEEAGDLGEAKRLWERLDPGGVVPDGECTRCGCLSYAMDDAEVAAAVRKLAASR